MAAKMLTLDQRARILTCLQALRQKDGGYAVEGHGRSGLQHTVHVWKALRLLDGRIADERATLTFVHRCYDAHAGGFGERPGAGPTVLATALGLIVLRGLEDRAAPGERTQPAMRFLVERARSAMDHFMVVAAHEEAALPGPAPAGSFEYFRAARLADGTFGESAFANAIGSGAIVLAQHKLMEPEPIISRLLRAQSPEGGFADHEGPADLLTTYAAVRALVLLERAPDLTRLRRYLGSIHRPDGGFAMRPGAPTSAAATYQALAVLAWMGKLRTGKASEQTFTPSGQTDSGNPPSTQTRSGPPTTARSLVPGPEPSAGSASKGVKASATANAGDVRPGGAWRSGRGSRKA
jgi:prenyltransferase beta subunit